MKINDYANIIKFLYESNKCCSWYSCFGTSIATYIEQINKLNTYYPIGTIIDLSNDEFLQNFIKNIGMKPTSSLSKINQRLSLWILMGIVEKNNKNTYTIINHINLNNVKNIFINNSLNMIRNNFNQNKSSLAIFNGFVLYLMNTYLNVDVFNQIIRFLDQEKENQRIVNKIINTISPKLSGKSNSFKNGTFEKFNEQYFNEISDANSLDFFLIDIFSEFINFNYEKDSNESVDQNSESKKNEINNLINEINKIISENEVKKSKDEKYKLIKSKVRNCFISNMKKNVCRSDLIINNEVVQTILLHEYAHVYSASKITKDLINHSNNKKFNNIINDYWIMVNSEDNGLYIPVNYHEMLDNDLIKIDWENKKFIFNDRVNEENKKFCIDVLGFNENNKINSDRIKSIEDNYNGIIEILDNIVKND